MPARAAPVMIDRIWRWMAWFGIIVTLVLSLMPPVLDDHVGHTDKIVHLAGYTLLMFWWAQLVTSRRWKLALAVVVFGIVIELLQGFTPARQPDILDALANTCGVLLGWLIARALPNLPSCLASRPSHQKL